mgnify:CR=1 FL=1
MPCVVDIWSKSNEVDDRYRPGAGARIKADAKPRNDILLNALSGPYRKPGGQRRDCEDLRPKDERELPTPKYKGRNGRARERSHCHA